jgi:arginase
MFEQCTRVSYAVKHNLKLFSDRIVWGSPSALGTISGIKSVYPTKRLGVV